MNGGSRPWIPATLLAIAGATIVFGRRRAAAGGGAGAGNGGTPPTGTGPATAPQQFATGNVIQIVACRAGGCRLLAAPTNEAATPLPPGLTLRLLEQRRDGYSRVQLNSDGGAVGYVTTANLRPAIGPIRE